MIRPTTRLAAAQQGYTQYFTGKPCKNGHVSHRYTASGQCAKCACEKAATLWKAGVRQRPEVREKANKNWNDSEKAKIAKQRWREKDPKRAWATYSTGTAKARAALKKLPFDITSEYIDSITPDACPVFGTPFQFIGSKKMSVDSATIDRLDPEKGYVKGNVVVISLKANTMKNAYNSTDLFTVAEWLRSKGY